MATADQATRVESSASVPLDELSATDSLASSSAGLFDRLGRYVLLDRLGRGAFGAVWTAYDPQLDRRVAIKVVHARKRKDEDGHAELLREAQLLAQLSHPNIVAIHDVGRLEDALESSTSSPAGEPMVGVFIVMEHLSGPSLADWLAGKHDAAELVRVFAEAGRGLEAAHARDLVHLDFKPSNVMFSADGRVCVLDFGLARVGRRLKRDAKQRRAGTPAYMAPEQHEGKPADARADQFAFCVSLWEALYGERPFVGQNADELYASKRQGPPKLSPAQIRLPHVHAAVERGLAFEPERRFASMDELLVVLADNPRLRRRRWVAGIALVGSLLGLGFGLARASDEQGDPCALPAGQFEGVWDSERRAAVEAAFTATGAPFAADSFTAVAAVLDRRIQEWAEVRRDVCRSALVDAVVPVEQMSEEVLCLDRHLRSVASLSDALLGADVEVVARARDLALELDDPDECRSRASSSSTAGAARRSALLEVEDALARARVARELGRYEESKAAADRAIDRATELDDVTGLARAQRERAVVLRDLGQLDEARREAIAGLASAAKAGAYELESQLLVDLIHYDTLLGEFAAGLAVRELVAARIDPAASPELAIEAHLRASTLHERQQHWDEALAELDAALALREAGVIVDDRLLGEVHNAYGNALMGSGRDFERGVAEYQEAIAVWSKAFGEHHPLIPRARMNLGSGYYRQGKFAPAIELTEAALLDLEQLYPEDHPLVSACQQNLGALRWITGDLSGAREHTLASLAVAERRFGTDHPDYAGIERNLASLLLALGEHREAAERYAHAAKVYEASLEPSDSRRMAVDAELAEIAWWLGDEDEARARAERVAAALEEAEATDYRRMGPLSTLATFAIHDGELERAEQYARELVALGQIVLGTDHPDFARAQILLAEALRGRGDFEGARALLALALASLQRPTGAHPIAWAAHLELGRLALAEGRRDAALEELEQALALAQGPGGAAVHAAIVELELADLLGADQRERATSLREHALETLREREVRPDLVAAHGDR